MFSTRYSTSEPKVPYLVNSIVYENIGRLDVTMQYKLGSQVLTGLSYLKGGTIPKKVLLVINDGLKRSFFTKLSDNIAIVSGIEDVQ